MRAARFLTLLGFVTGVSLAEAQVSRPPYLDPDAIDTTLAPGQTQLESKALDIPPLDTQPVDIVFAIDSTLSVGPAINELKNQTGSLVTALSSIYLDLNVGLVDFKDYTGCYDSNPICNYNGHYNTLETCLHDYRRLTPNLSPTGPFFTGINQILASGGGDLPECHGGILQWLVDDVNNLIGWRPGSYRLVVMLTDTFAHDCDFCAVRPGSCPNTPISSPGAAPGNGGLDPGLFSPIDDGTYPDDAPIVPTIDRMAGTGLHGPIKLATIFARTLPDDASDEIGARLDNSDPPGVWQILSRMAHGDGRAVDGNGLPPLGVDLADFVESLIVDVNLTCNSITARAFDPAFDSWITIDGSPLPHTLGTDITPPIRMNFEVQITPPGATPSGGYAFELHTFCDEQFLASQSISVTVTSCQPGAPDVTENTLFAVRTLPPAGEFSWSTTGSGSWNLHATGDDGEIPDLWMDPTKIEATVTSPAAPDDGTFPIGFYQVYGADNCTGASVPYSGLSSVTLVFMKGRNLS